MRGAPTELAGRLRQGATIANLDRELRDRLVHTAERLDNATAMVESHDCCGLELLKLPAYVRAYTAARECEQAITDHILRGARAD